VLTPTIVTGGVNRPSHLPLSQSQRQIGFQSSDSAAFPPLLDTVGINEQLGHNHRSRQQRRRNKKRKYFQPLKHPSIRKTKEAAALRLRAAGYPDLAEKIEQCGRHQLVKICRSCERNKKPCVHGLGHVVDPCGLTWLCPDCGRARALRTQKRLLPKIRKFAHHHNYRPIFITLTVKNGFDLAERRQVLLDSFRRLRERQCWDSHISGAVAEVEVSFNPAHGWHPHLHILAFRKGFWDVKELSASWLSVTRGEGYIVDIRDVKDLAGAIVELLKYMTKPMDVQKMGPNELHELVFSLRGKHMLLTLGDLRDFRLSKVDMKVYGDGEEDYALCSQCGEPLSQIMASSYALERISQSVVVRGP